MDKRFKEFQIRDLLEITKDKKYAVTVAAFEIVENFDKLNLELEKLGWKSNKISVIAMMCLARNLIKYDFITDEQRKQLEEELKNLDNIHLRKAEALFQKKKMLKDSEEDLSDEDIGEIITEKATINDDYDESKYDDEDNDEDSDSYDDSDDD
ncbi:MAG: hypothetical protein NZ853_10555 [Leptospiraceae bacterium]|nr:hypothetical protein [Leptospiraceae bacterium]MDW7977107.1 hypothetical protein [Leptospiraceae bacterium]